MNFKNYPIFPKYVGVVNIGIVNNWLEKVENEEYRRLDHLSCSDYFLQRNPKWKPLTDMCLKAANEWVKTIGYDIDLFCNSAWVNKYSPGDYAPDHRHENSFVSGCYYFEDSTGISFSEYQPNFENILKIPKARPEEFIYEPKAGDLCLFMSSSNHGSLVSDKMRYTFAFNAFPTEIGAPLTNQWVKVR